MTNDPEKVRAALEYEEVGLNGTTLRAYRGLGGARFQGDWEWMLAHFLDDEWEDSAKMEDIHWKMGSAIDVTSATVEKDGIAEEGWLVTPRFNKGNVDITADLFATTLHEAINKCWLAAHGFEDPRVKA